MPVLSWVCQPVIWGNAEKIGTYRDEMLKYYYDASQYAT